MKLPLLDRRQAVEQVTVALTLAKFPLLFVSLPSKEPALVFMSMALAESS
jgi:hypothetical protein